MFMRGLTLYTARLAVPAVHWKYQGSLQRLGLPVSITAPPPSIMTEPAWFSDKVRGTVTQFTHFFSVVKCAGIRRFLLLVVTTVVEKHITEAWQKKPYVSQHCVDPFSWLVTCAEACILVLTTLKHSSSPSIVTAWNDDFKCWCHAHELPVAGLILQEHFYFFQSVSFNKNSRRLIIC